MKISDSCFAITGLFYLPPWTVNSGFIVGDQKTLVIDSSGTYLSAQTIFGYASIVRPSNEIILINTEKHLDHIGGNSFFSEKGILIYGHELIHRKESDFVNQVLEANTIAELSDKKRTKEGEIAFRRTTLVNPNLSISENSKIELGNLSVDIILTPGHTDTNISIYCSTEKVLYVGDCIIEAYYPNLDEANREKWLSSLNVIENLEIETIVPGHGEVIKGKIRIEEEISRIRNILTFS